MDAPISASIDSPRLDTLGETIRERRRDLGLTQAQLAERMGWTQERVSIIENGKYGLPSIMGLTRLATALELPLAILIAAIGLPDEGFGLGAPDNGQTHSATALLRTVNQLMDIESPDLKEALDQASTILAGSMGADKIDAFLLEPATATLVALGASATPMAATQHRLGLDRMPLANATREAEVYQTGQSYCCGSLDQDERIAPGVISGMGAHSMLAVPLHIGGERRGVLAALSTQFDRFSDDDISFLEIAARWVGMVAHRAELVEEITITVAQAARHAAVEEIITLVAHDLTGPLTPLKEQLGILHGKLQRAESTDELINVDAALSGVTRMEGLINDLLDTSRLEEGLFSLTLQELDLAALVRTVVQTQHTDEAPISVDAPTSLVLHADSRQITRVLENLLSNASQYAPAGVHVSVEQARGLKDNEPWAQITVADEGPGIPEEVLPTLFHRFSAGPHSTGPGLGLYLARGIAEAHGGTLTVETNRGAGSRFALSLPMHGTALAGEPTSS
ncbi:MAG: hypothetical protein NVSMB52_18920 [Chloroflexota bacterium]